ncbi:MAG: amidase domain-containing protein [Clostridia bacterium]|nr:amidase domain-containing protein [Clostridia bacterium]
MILEKEYQRERAVLYARKYALVRNPLFYSFEGIGGNCTSFASQCVLAGSCVMNFTPIFGWFYLSSNSRAPAWSGVEFFYNFMIGNRDVGPFGQVVDISQAMVGDIIQLQNEKDVFYHTLVITEIRDGEIYICANSVDSLDRALSSYTYKSLRVIHIQGVRYDTRFIIDCFDSLYSPPLPPVETPTGETTPPTDTPPTGETTPPTDTPPTGETTPPTDTPPTGESS